MSIASHTIPIMIWFLHITVAVTVIDIDIDIHIDIQVWLFPSLGIESIRIKQSTLRRILYFGNFGQFFHHLIDINQVIVATLATVRITRIRIIIRIIATAITITIIEGMESVAYPSDSLSPGRIKSLYNIGSMFGRAVVDIAETVIQIVVPRNIEIYNILLYNCIYCI